jgi:hypothetical protein
MRRAEGVDSWEETMPEGECILDCIICEDKQGALHGAAVLIYGHGWDKGASVLYSTNPVGGHAASYLPFSIHGVVCNGQRCPVRYA